MSNNVSNIENEIRFIGSLFTNNDLYLEYEKIIKSKYYFDDEVCRNLYEWLSVLYANEQKFNEKNLVVYVNQSEERTRFYKSMEGWRTISGFMDIADTDEFKSYFLNLQKFALLREYESKGIDTSRIRNHPKFEKSSADQIYKSIRGMVDTIHTAIASDAEVMDISDNVVPMVDGFIDRPAMGIPTFLPSYNELFLGFQKNSMLCFGLQSNFGKTRFLAKISAFNALVMKQKTLLMLNEMSYDQLQVAVLTTVINNEEFHHLHGYTNISKVEREIKLGLYRNDDGDLITRKKDKDGNFAESIEEYRDRIKKQSSEYRSILRISQWLENDGFKKYLTVLDVKKDYTDGSLANHMRKNARKGYGFIAYDNLKNMKDNLGNWASLIGTTTTLSETAKEEGVFCWGSIQLTDDTSNYDVLDLDSNNIAASKGLKSVLDSLVLGKQIEPEKYKRYRYIPTSGGMGDSSKMLLPLPDVEGFVLQGHIPDKNREGSKLPILIQIDLNRNIWRELGILTRSS